MRFGSVCSGIEAASVAWHPLGWKAAWLSEIEPFPSAVLAHHYPDVPNLGDMTTLPRRILLGDVEAPDLFCGGTPCQAFSVAGLRQSLDDARGNLSLTFCEIADAIDHVRGIRGEQPAIVFWENVPGVLSTKDNAFGCFLAGLAGEDDPLQPPGGKWSSAGAVYGPQRAVAWRTLDAQYFGVAQRRRRVFVVASARNDFDPAAVLFEWDGLRRDTAPSRETGEGTAAGAARSVALRGREGGATAELGDDAAGCLRASSGGGDKPHVLAAQPYEVANCLTARMHKGLNSTLDEGRTPVVTHSLRGEGFDASEDGTGRGTPLVPVAFVQNSRDEVRLMGGNGDLVGAMAAETGAKQQCYVAQPVAFHPTQDPISSENVCHSIGANNNATAAVAIGWDEELNASTEQSGALLRGGQGGRHDGVMTPVMQVRRLTPVECERLQGFPDNYTAIPWRNKPADQCPDGPRYKALGNSWAVPSVRWIGQRIAKALA